MTIMESSVSCPQGSCSRAVRGGHQESPHTVDIACGTCISSITDSIRTRDEPRLLSPTIESQLNYVLHVGRQFKALLVQVKPCTGRLQCSAMIAYLLQGGGSTDGCFASLAGLLCVY